MKRLDSLVRLVAGLGLVAVVFLAGFNVAAAATIEEIANLTGPERQKILEEGAREEGTVFWIGGLNERRARSPIIEAFEKKYPFIEVQGVRMGSSESLQRILAETRAGTPNIDIVNGNIVVPLKEADLLQSFKSPVLESYPEGELDPNGYWAPLRYSYHGVAGYNTNLVPAEDAPKSYQDLLDPKWKGRLVWGDSFETGAQLLITYLRRVWGDEKAEDYLEKLAKQDIVTRTSSIRSILDLVAAGEHAIQINAALHHVAGAREKGAPVDAAMESPVLARIDHIMLLKNAQHPHAAMLFIDFLLEKEAQTILQKAKYYPAHPEVDPAQEMKPYQPRTKGMKQFTINAEILEEEKAQSDELFQRLFQ